jgi:hypothetical protein
MEFGELLSVLFSGIGATLVGVYLTKRLGSGPSATVQVTDKLSVTTRRNEPPIVYQPVVEPKAAVPSATPTGLAGKPHTLQFSDRYTFISPFSVLPTGVTQVDWKPVGELGEIKTVDLSSFNLPETTYNTSVPMKWDDPSSITPHKPPRAMETWPAPNFNFDLDPIATKLVSFGDDTAALVNKDKFLFVDQKEGLFIASAVDGDKWDAVEIIRKPDEVVCRWKKKQP